MSACIGHHFVQSFSKNFCLQSWKMHLQVLVTEVEGVVTMSVFSSLGEQQHSLLRGWTWCSSKLGEFKMCSRWVSKPRMTVVSLLVSEYGVGIGELSATILFSWSKPLKPFKCKLVRNLRDALNMNFALSLQYSSVFFYQLTALDFSHLFFNWWICIMQK